VNGNLTNFNTMISSCL